MDHVGIAETMFSQASILAWGTSAFVILSIYLLQARHVLRSSSRAAPKVASASSHGIQLRTTQFLPCSISHCRLFPKQHKFKYPYLSVGVPVRSPSSNWLLSVDNQPWWERGWFHVSPKDHLHRGRDGATLSENIDAYLKLQVCRFGLGTQETLLSSLVNEFSKGPGTFWLSFHLPLDFTPVSQLCV
jgi:hypothetical protein